jgi:hypothetical protein
MMAVAYRLKSGGNLVDSALCDCLLEPIRIVLSFAQKVHYRDWFATRPTGMAVTVTRNGLLANRTPVPLRVVRPFHHSRPRAPLADTRASREIILLHLGPRQR